ERTRGERLEEEQVEDEDGGAEADGSEEARVAGEGEAEPVVDGALPRRRQRKPGEPAREPDHGAHDGGDEPGVEQAGENTAAEAGDVEGRGLGARNRRDAGGRGRLGQHERLTLPRAEK